MKIHNFEKQNNWKVSHSYLSNGLKTITLKLPGFIQSSVLAIYSGCDNFFILRVDNSLALVLLLYVQKQKKIKRIPNCLRKAFKLRQMSAEDL